MTTGPIRKLKTAKRAASETSTTPKTGEMAAWDRIDARPTKPAIEPKWRWHYRVLLGLRERLLKDQRQHFEEAAEPLEAHSMDMGDSATDEFDHDMALSNLSAEQNALFEIEAALKRLASRSYGICEESGQPIPLARLKAIPWTRFAREVEARHEQEGSTTRSRLGALGSVQPLAVNLDEGESPDNVGREEAAAADKELSSFVLLPDDRRRKKRVGPKPAGRARK